MNLLGSVLNAPMSPFAEADRLVDFLRTTHEATVILVDFHAEATSEKLAMGYFWTVG